jgi:hypothetical protein
MPNQKLILTTTLLILLLIGYKRNNQDSSRMDIASRKEEIKDSINKMLKTYEYSYLAILFDCKIALNMNTMEFDAEEIWEFSDEEPKDFIEWYELNIKPQKQQLKKRNTNTSKALQVQTESSIEQNIHESDKEKIIDNEDEKSSYLHLLMIYEVFLQLTLEDKDDFKIKLKTELSEKKDLNEKVKYLEKKTKREEKLVSNLKTKILNLKQEISENKKDFQEENEKLDKYIKKKYAKKVRPNILKEGGKIQQNFIKENKRSNFFLYNYDFPKSSMETEKLNYLESTPQKKRKKQKRSPIGVALDYSLKGNEYAKLEKKTYISLHIIEDDNLVGDFFSVEFDRNLQSLIDQPWFKQVKGLVIGRFQKETDINFDKLKHIIRTKQALSSIPVIVNMDFGHTAPMFTFPIGGQVKILAKNDRIVLEIKSH